MKSLLLGALLLAAASIGAEPVAPIAKSAIPMTPIPTRVATCCKHCSAGKACGNSCISKSKQCRKGKGCACDG